jgi:hypothetical protein
LQSGNATAFPKREFLKNKSGKSGMFFEPESDRQLTGVSPAIHHKFTIEKTTFCVGPSSKGAGVVQLGVDGGGDVGSESERTVSSPRLKVAFRPPASTFVCNILQIQTSRAPNPSDSIALSGGV